jgi:hypothetical protein
MAAVLRIRLFSIPDPNFLNPGSASKNLSILTYKLVSKLLEICFGLFIPDPDLTFYPSRIPDPGVKKAPDPGSGSATLHGGIMPVQGKIREPNKAVFVKE